MKNDELVALVSDAPEAAESADDIDAVIRLRSL